MRRGLEDSSPACRGSALLSLERLGRDHPGVINGVRPLLHELVAHDDNEAVRRLAIVALRNGSPERSTIQILAALGEDDEQEKELRETAAKVAQLLRKKAPGSSARQVTRVTCPRSLRSAGVRVRREVRLRRRLSETCR